MEIEGLLTKMEKLSPKVRSVLERVFQVLPLERAAKAIPAVRRMLDAEYDKIIGKLKTDAKPYSLFPQYKKLPLNGINRDKILQMMADIAKQETSHWQDGFVSGAVYHGDSAHIGFLNKVYSLHSQTNPLHSDLWPSINKYEAEIIAMVGSMLGARKTKDKICGALTSGGSESIMLAVKTYRDYAHTKRRIRKPELVVPETAHAAFDKACQFFAIKKVVFGVDKGFRADVRKAKRAITRNTIALVGSAPTFPHGVVDPIPELADLAHSRGIGFHTDACLGGFMLPWLDSKYQVPPFDFRVRGVTSISADTHKYGYSAKGSSVVLYRNPELRRFQFYTITDWPGGLYFSPTFSGSRSGAVSAQAWASLVSMGEAGYRKAAQRIMSTAEEIAEGIRKIPDLKLMADPLWIIAFGSDSLNIFGILDEMSKRKWNLNALHRPACVHLCVTLRHTQAGVADRFLTDLRAAVRRVRDHPVADTGMAPVYGMGGTIPARGMVSDLLKRYLDLLYEP